MCLSFSLHLTSHRPRCCLARRLQLQFLAILVFGAISSALPYGGSGSGGDFSSGPGGGGHDLSSLNGGLIDQFSGNNAGSPAPYPDSYSNAGAGSYGGDNNAGAGGYGGNSNAGYNGDFSGIFLLRLMALRDDLCYNSY